MKCHYQLPCFPFPNSPVVTAPWNTPPFYADYIKLDASRRANSLTSTPQRNCVYLSVNKETGLETFSNVNTTLFMLPALENDAQKAPSSLAY